ncbi:MAG: tRNA lysidine(34) synthetase TilS [Pararhodobacter sp.]
MNTSAAAQALTAFLTRHRLGGRFGVAVSGGGDSMALLVLAAEAGVVGAVVSIDHGLRPEASEETGVVATLCAALGVTHTVLRWHHDGHGNLQAAARAGRRALIAEWAQKRGLAGVFLGHTLDDQAETVLMRLARGSGVDGLGGMAEATTVDGVPFLRPFLSVSRASLRAELTARGIGWCEDPSNRDARFARVRAREALAALAPLGLDAAGLARTATRMQRVRQALQAQVSQVLSAHVREAAGTVVLAPAVLDLLPEIRDRVFLHCLRGLTGAAYPPRHAALVRWIEAAQAGRAAPLMGCILRPERDGLRLFREPAAVAGLVAPADGLWDGRWRAEPGPGADPGAAAAGLVMRALGQEGLLALSRGAAAGRHGHWRDTGLPRAALEAQPGLWCGDTLVAAPGAGWVAGWRLRVASVVPGRAGGQGAPGRDEAAQLPAD